MLAIWTLNQHIQWPSWNWHTKCRSIDGKQTMQYWLSVKGKKKKGNVKIYKMALPFPAQIPDRPLLQPKAKQDNKNHNVPKYNMTLKGQFKSPKSSINHLFFTSEACKYLFWEKHYVLSPQMTGSSYLYVVLPQHPQEVQYCVRQRTLSSNIGPGTWHSLETKNSW